MFGQDQIFATHLDVFLGELAAGDCPFDASADIFLGEEMQRCDGRFRLSACPEMGNDIRRLLVAPISSFGSHFACSICMIEGAPGTLAALHPPPMPNGYGADTPRIEAFDLLDTRPRILGKIWL